MTTEAYVEEQVIPAEVQKEYVAQSVELMKAKAENERLRAQKQPQSDSDTYPKILPDGRKQYGSFDDERFADPFQPLHHARNDPSDYAWKVAWREREFSDALEATRLNSPKMAEDGIHELDEDGNMIPTAFEEGQARLLNRFEEVLSTEPRWRWDQANQQFVEWLHTDLPDHAEENDPQRSVDAAKELRHRERERRTAFITLRAQPSSRAGTIDAQMRAAGLLPPLNADNPEHAVTAIREKAHAGIRAAVDQTMANTPEARAVAEFRAEEAEARGQHSLANDIRNGVA